MRSWVASFALLLAPCPGAVAGSPEPPVSACASCHRAEALSQPSTSMAHALERIADTEILGRHPSLIFQEGRTSFRIAREGDRVLYTVARGSDALTVPIAFAVGLGSAGQTYVYLLNGAWYESRVSFFQAIEGLDLTLGHAPGDPPSLEEAAGRQLNFRETAQCFGCHATHAVHDTRVQLDSLAPGVQCERCHGPAEKHVAAVKAGDDAGAAMRRLGALSTEDMSDFCGQCHRTWSQIASEGPHDVKNVRFQPYRLTNSKCYDPTDHRIGCIACHDPHREVERTPAFYDTKCLACHGASTDRPREAKACPTAVRNCVTCHMPKYEIPGSHNLFSDHRIRVVKPGERYPG